MLKQLPLLVFLFSLLIIECIFDYYFDNADGLIRQYHLSKLFAIAYFLLIPLILFSWSKRYHSRVLFSIGAFIFLFFIVEIASWGILKIKQPYLYLKTNPSLLISDPILGHKLLSDQVVSSILHTKTDTIYEVTYSIDTIGKRKTSRSAIEDRSKFACFFGCSFTFGKGVNDWESLPGQVQLKNTSYRSYNFGCNGYGPNHVLQQLQYVNWKTQIAEPIGFGMYLFIEDHLRRSIGTMRNITQSIYLNAPKYKVEQGKLNYQGVFKTASSYVQKKGYHFLNMSYFLQLVGFDFPWSLSEEHYKLNARLIEQIAHQFKMQFPEQSFYLLIYPGEDNQILNYIDSNELIVLDYSNLFERGKYIIPIDRHPNTKAYEIIATQLSKDLIK